jgi:hypothetical protein
MAMVEERMYEEYEYKEYEYEEYEDKEYKDFDMFNTDRDIVKGHTTFKFEENEEDEEFDEEFNTDRDIVKGHITFNFKENEEDEEVPAWTRNGGDDRDGGDRAAHDVGQNSNTKEVPCPLLQGGCNQEEF